MEFAFDIGDDDDDDDDEAYFTFGGGRGGEADILNAMLMGQMMGGNDLFILISSNLFTYVYRWTRWWR